MHKLPGPQRLKRAPIKIAKSTPNTFHEPERTTSKIRVKQSQKTSAKGVSKTPSGNKKEIHTKIPVPLKRSKRNSLSLQNNIEKSRKSTRYTTFPRKGTEAPCSSIESCPLPLKQPKEKYVGHGTKFEVLPLITSLGASSKFMQTRRNQSQDSIKTSSQCTSKAKMEPSKRNSLSGRNISNGTPFSTSIENSSKSLKPQTYQSLKTGTKRASTTRKSESETPKNASNSVKRLKKKVPRVSPETQKSKGSKLQKSSNKTANRSMIQRANKAKLEPSKKIILSDQNKVEKSLGASRKASSKSMNTGNLSLKTAAITTTRKSARKAPSKDQFPFKRSKKDTAVSARRFKKVSFVDVRSEAKLKSEKSSLKTTRAPVPLKRLKKTPSILRSNNNEEVSPINSSFVASSKPLKSQGYQLRKILNKKATKTVETEAKLKSEKSPLRALPRRSSKPLKTQEKKPTKTVIKRHITGSPRNTRAPLKRPKKFSVNEETLKTPLKKSNATTKAPKTTRKKSRNQSIPSGARIQEELTDSYEIRISQNEVSKTNPNQSFTDSSNASQNTLPTMRIRRESTRKLKVYLLEPVIRERKIPIINDTSDIQLAKKSLHVSSVPNILVCREKEFKEMFELIESKILENDGG